MAITNSQSVSEDKFTMPGFLCRVIGFVVLLLLAAFAGHWAAERWVLPHSPPLKGVVAPGLTLAVPDDEESSHAGRDAAMLRQFLFALHNGFNRPELMREGGIVPVEPAVRIQTMETDADMVRVRFLEGSLEDQELWMKARPFLEADGG